MEPPEHIAHNVETVASLRAHAEEDVSVHQRRIEWATSALGRPRSMYIAVLLVAAWMFVNGRARELGLPELDPPPYPYLEFFVSLAALLMTFMVLTTQNRQNKFAERRAHLDLQVNLLAEQKVTKLIALVEELRRDLSTAPHHGDAVAEKMSEPLDPAAVVTALDDTFEGSGAPRVPSAPSPHKVASGQPQSEPPRMQDQRERSGR
jgi:uncharacterized membrane protein